MSNKPYGGRIENWYTMYGIVYGNLFNDPNKRFGKDGVTIHTSTVVSWNETKSIETLNTRYDLGEPATL